MESHGKRPRYCYERGILREIESLLSKSTKNAIWIDYIKFEINNAQHNSKSRLCVDLDKTVNFMTNKGCKFAQKEYKTKHESVQKVIHMELCNPVD